MRCARSTLERWATSSPTSRMSRSAPGCMRPSNPAHSIGRSTAVERRELLRRLTEVEAFERFLHSTFLGQKRFSIEGTDMLVPMLDELIHDAGRGRARARC